MADDREADPARWYSTNLVGVPAPILASTAFNDHPQRLRVAGSRTTNGGLFAMLERSGDADEAREIFEHYMSAAFSLSRQRRDETAAETRRWKASYLRLLLGWGQDSNGPSGALLKGWVESRFGIMPTFHTAPLQRFPSPAWITYLEQKGSSRYHNNNIFQQLDLLFEFCQWMLERFQLLGEGPRVPLWRGTTRCEEQLVAGTLRQRHCTMRLNNLVSFSRSREEAEIFGDWVLHAQVPLAKLLFVPGLLHGSSLRGEAEVLALGGNYEVEARYD
jgi:NAD+--dinitrogen-reductase ADP-D-ribosyltransferase